MYNKLKDLIEKLPSKFASDFRSQMNSSGEITNLYVRITKVLPCTVYVDSGDDEIVVSYDFPKHTEVTFRKDGSVDGELAPELKDYFDKMVIPKTIQATNLKPLFDAVKRYADNYDGAAYGTYPIIDDQLVKSIKLENTGVNLKVTLSSIDVNDVANYQGGKVLMMSACKGECGTITIDLSNYDIETCINTLNGLASRLLSLTLV